MRDRDIINYEGTESAVNASAICGTCTSDAEEARQSQRLYRMGLNGRIEGPAVSQTGEGSQCTLF